MGGSLRGGCTETAKGVGATSQVSPLAMVAYKTDYGRRAGPVECGGEGLAVGIPWQYLMVLQQGSLRGRESPVLSQCYGERCSRGADSAVI